MIELRNAKVIKKTITLEYSCEKDSGKNSVKLSEFEIRDGQYFEDWHYKYVFFKCPLCGIHHSFEI